jgi:hypothetical protein
MALQWDMYGRGSTVAFNAHRVAGGYDMTVTRDAQLLIRAHADNQATLLMRSSALRERLQSIGFVPQPDAQATQVGGGLCWGPAAPIESSLVEAFF